MACTQGYLNNPCHRKVQGGYRYSLQPGYGGAIAAGILAGWFQGIPTWAIEAMINLVPEPHAAKDLLPTILAEGWIGDSLLL